MILCSETKSRVMIPCLKSRVTIPCFLSYIRACVCSLDQTNSKRKPRDKTSSGDATKDKDGKGKF